MPTGGAAEAGWVDKTSPSQAIRAHEFIVVSNVPDQYTPAAAVVFTGTRVEME
jgi:hypothetical protein